MPTVVNGGNTSKKETVQDNNTRVQTEETMQDHNTHMATEETRKPTISQQIQVHQIVNSKVPVVVFVGPPASGKSMILVRLAKYLRKQGYTINPDGTFINTIRYEQSCKEFKDKLNTNIALSGTVEYLLVDVYKEGTLIAKLLEAPGEDFYDPANNEQAKANNQKILPYLANIIASKNPKTYVTLLDLDSEISFRKDSYYRESYTQRLMDFFFHNIDDDRDRIILLYNKIDCTQFGNIHGCKKETNARADAELYYPTLFASLKIDKFGGLLKMDNFCFKTFCTGIFSDAIDDYGKPYQTYNVSNDIYPKELWNEITKKW